MATDYSFVASGGIRISGPRHYKLDACYEASGGIAIGGSAVVNSVNTSYSYSMMGGITVSGPNDNIVDYDYKMVMTGSLVTLGGSANVILDLHSHAYTMTGGIHLGGSYTGQAQYIYEGTGGIAVSGTSGSSGSVPEIYVDFSTSWVVFADVIADLEIGWNTGQSIFYFYRVEGVCLPYGCPPIADDSASEQPCSFSFIKNVVADSVCDVCAQLKRDGFIRTIKSIKKFSIPARPADRALLEAEGVTLDCNRLETVEFCQCVECTMFCDYESIVINPTGFETINTALYEQGYEYLYNPNGLVSVTPTEDGNCYVAYTTAGYYGSNGYINLGSREIWRYPCPNVTQVVTVDVPNFSANVSGKVRISGQAIVSWKPNVVDAEPDAGVVKTGCDCSTLPTKIWMKHNLSQANKLKDFLYRNAYTLDNNLPLYYDANNQSWFSNLNWNGLSRDGVTTEVWNIIFEWACTAQIGGQDLGSPVWKFGAYFNVRNVQNNTTSNTRILMTFSKKGPCVNGELDFTMNLNTNTLVSESIPSAEIDNVLFIDGIGIFNSAYWTKNPKFRVSLSNVEALDPVRNVVLGPYPPTNEIVRKL